MIIKFLNWFLSWLGFPQPQGTEEPRKEDVVKKPSSSEPHRRRRGHQIGWTLRDGALCKLS